MYGDHWNTREPLTLFWGQLHEKIIEICRNRPLLIEELIHAEFHLITHVVGELFTLKTVESILNNLGKDSPQLGLIAANLNGTADDVDPSDALSQLHRLSF